MNELKVLKAIDDEFETLLSTNHLLELLERFPNEEWDEVSLSNNPNISWEFICKNPDIPWASEWVSSNPNISFAIVKANLDYQWDWCALSSMLPHEDVLLNFHHDAWDFYGLSFNPDITWVFVDRTRDEAWYWPFLSENPNITYKDCGVICKQTMGLGAIVKQSRYHLGGCGDASRQTMVLASGVNEPKHHV